MKEIKELEIKTFANALEARYDGRRILFFPHEHGINFVFHRVLDKEEKAKLKEDPTAQLLTTGTTIIGGRIFESNINLSYEAAMVMCLVLERWQKQLRTRQIVNTLCETPEHKLEFLNLLDDMSEDDWFTISEMFDNDRDNINEKMYQIKAKVVADHLMMQTKKDELDA